MAGAVRAACLADIPRIFEIRAAVRENRLADPSRVTHADAVWFVEAGALFVWEEAGQIGGFSAGDPRDGSIWALFVDPSWEGQGLGQALLAAACAVLKASGYGTVRLSTDPGTRAERFYLRNGWTAGEIDGRGERTFTRLL